MHTIKIVNKKTVDFAIILYILVKMTISKVFLWVKIIMKKIVDYVYYD